MFIFALISILYIFIIKFQEKSPVIIEDFSYKFKRSHLSQLVTIKATFAIVFLLVLCSYHNYGQLFLVSPSHDLTLLPK